MYVDTNAISKNLPYLLHRTLNNAQNAQQKLGIAFSYLERNDSNTSRQSRIMQVIPHYKLGVISGIAPRRWKKLDMEIR